MEKLAKATPRLALQVSRIETDFGAPRERPEGSFPISKLL